jgi:hypothetical protein
MSQVDALPSSPASSVTRAPEPRIGRATAIIPLAERLAWVRNRYVVTSGGRDRLPTALKGAQIPISRRIVAAPTY